MIFQKILQAIGIASGLLIAGFFNVMPWSTLAMIMVAVAVLIVVVPPKYSDHNPVVVSISVWIAVGMTAILVLTFVFGTIPHLGWSAGIWILLSVMIGWLKPFPLPKK